MMISNGITGIQGNSNYAMSERTSNLDNQNLLFNSNNTPEDTFENSSAKKIATCAVGIAAVGTAIYLAKSGKGKELLGKIKNLFKKNADKADDLANTAKLKDVTFKNGTAHIDGKKFTGVISDTTKSGKKVQLTYENGNIIQSKMDDVLKQYTYGKDGKKLTTSVTRNNVVNGHQNVSNTLIGYNKNGKVSQMVSSNCVDSVAPANKIKVQNFTYDSSGKLGIHLTKRHIGNELNITRDIYSNGKLHNRVGYYTGTSAGSGLAKYEASFHANGNKVNEAWYDGYVDFVQNK